MRNLPQINNYITTFMWDQHLKKEQITNAEMRLQLKIMLLFLVSSWPISSGSIAQKYESEQNVIPKRR